MTLNVGQAQVVVRLNWNEIKEQMPRLGNYMRTRGTAIGEGTGISMGTALRNMFRVQANKLKEIFSTTGASLRTEGRTIGNAVGKLMGQALKSGFSQSASTLPSKLASTGATLRTEARAIGEAAGVTLGTSLQEGFIARLRNIRGEFAQTGSSLKREGTAIGEATGASIGRSLESGFVARAREIPAKLAQVGARLRSEGATIGEATGTAMGRGAKTGFRAGLGGIGTALASKGAQLKAAAGGIGGGIGNNMGSAMYSSMQPHWNKASNGLKSHFQRLAKDMKVIGTNIGLALSIPIIGAFHKIIKEAPHVRQNIVDIGRAAGKLPDEMKPFEKQIYDLGKNGAASVGEISEAMLAMTKRGVQLEDAMAFMPKLMDTVKKTGISIYELMRATLGTGKTFGFAGNFARLDHLQKVLGLIAKQTPLTPQLIDMLDTYVAGQFKNMQLSPELMHAVAGRLKAIGERDSTIATGLSWFTRYLAPNKLSDETNKLLKDTWGIDAEHGGLLDMFSGSDQNFIKGLKKFAEMRSGNPKAWAQFMSGFSVQGARQIEHMLNNLDDIEKSAGKIDEWADEDKLNAALERANTQAETTTMRLQRLGQAAENMGVQFFNKTVIDKWGAGFLRTIDKIKGLWMGFTKKGKEALINLFKSGSKIGAALMAIKKLSPLTIIIIGALKKMWDNADKIRNAFEKVVGVFHKLPEPLQKAIKLVGSIGSKLMVMIPLIKKLSEFFKSLRFGGMKGGKGGGLDKMINSPIKGITQATKRALLKEKELLKTHDRRLAREIEKNNQALKQLPKGTNTKLLRALEQEKIVNRKRQDELTREINKETEQLKLVSKDKSFAGVKIALEKRVTALKADREKLIADENNITQQIKKAKAPSSRATQRLRAAQLKRQEILTAEQNAIIMYEEKINTALEQNVIPPPSPKIVMAANRVRAHIELFEYKVQQRLSKTATRIETLAAEQAALKGEGFWAKTGAAIKASMSRLFAAIRRRITQTMSIMIARIMASRFAIGMRSIYASMTEFWTRWSTRVATTIRNIGVRISAPIVNRFINIYEASARFWTRWSTRVAMTIREVGYKISNIVMTPLMPIMTAVAQFWTRWGVSVAMMIREVGYKISNVVITPLMSIMTSVSQFWTRWSVSVTSTIRKVTTRVVSGVKNSAFVKILASTNMFWTRWTTKVSLAIEKVSARVNIGVGRIAASSARIAAATTALFGKIASGVVKGVGMFGKALGGVLNIGMWAWLAYDIGKMVMDSFKKPMSELRNIGIPINDAVKRFAQIFKDAGIELKTVAQLVSKVPLPMREATMKTLSQWAKAGTLTEENAKMLESLPSETFQMFMRYKDSIKIPLEDAILIMQGNWQEAAPEIQEKIKKYAKELGIPPEDAAQLVAAGMENVAPRIAQDAKRLADEMNMPLPKAAEFVQSSDWGKLAHSLQEKAVSLANEFNLPPSEAAKLVHEGELAKLSTTQMALAAKMYQEYDMPVRKAVDALSNSELKKMDSDHQELALKLMAAYKLPVEQAIELVNAGLINFSPEQQMLAAQLMKAYKISAEDAIKAATGELDKMPEELRKKVEEYRNSMGLTHQNATFLAMAEAGKLGADMQKWAKSIVDGYDGNQKKANDEVEKKMGKLPGLTKEHADKMKTTYDKGQEDSRNNFEKTIDWFKKISKSTWKWIKKLGSWIDNFLAGASMTFNDTAKNYMYIIRRGGQKWADTAQEFEDKLPAESRKSILKYIAKHKLAGDLSLKQLEKLNDLPPEIAQYVAKFMENNTKPPEEILKEAEKFNKLPESQRKFVNEYINDFEGNFEKTLKYAEQIDRLPEEQKNFANKYFYAFKNNASEVLDALETSDIKKLPMFMQESANNLANIPHVSIQDAIELTAASMIEFAPGIYEQAGILKEKFKVPITEASEFVANAEYQNLGNEAYAEAEKLFGLFKLPPDKAIEAVQTSEYMNLDIAHRERAATLMQAYNLAPQQAAEAVKLDMDQLPENQKNLAMQLLHSYNAPPELAKQLVQVSEFSNLGIDQQKRAIELFNAYKTPAEQAVNLVKAGLMTLSKDQQSIATLLAGTYNFGAESAVDSAKQGLLHLPPDAYKRALELKNEYDGNMDKARAAAATELLKLPQSTQSKLNDLVKNTNISWQQVLTLAAAAHGNIEGITKEDGEKMVQQVGKHGENLAKVLKEIQDKQAKAQTEGVEKINKSLKEGIENIANTVKDKTEDAKKNADEKMKDVPENVKTNSDNTRKAFEDQTSSAATNADNNLKNVGTNVDTNSRNLANTISTALTRAQNKANEIIRKLNKAIADGARNAANIRIPTGNGIVAAGVGGEVQTQDNTESGQQSIGTTRIPIADLFTGIIKQYDISSTRAYKAAVRELKFLPEDVRIHTNQLQGEYKFNEFSAVGFAQSILAKIPRITKFATEKLKSLFTLASDKSNLNANNTLSRIPYLMQDKTTVLFNTYDKHGLKTNENADYVLKKIPPKTQEQTEKLQEIYKTNSDEANKNANEQLTPIPGIVQRYTELIQNKFKETMRMVSEIMSKLLQSVQDNTQSIFRSYNDNLSRAASDAASILSQVLGSVSSSLSSMANSINSALARAQQAANNIISNLNAAISRAAARAASIQSDMSGFAVSQIRSPQEIMGMTAPESIAPSSDIDIKEIDKLTQYVSNNKNIDIDINAETRSSATDIAEALEHAMWRANLG